MARGHITRYIETLKQITLLQLNPKLILTHIPKLARNSPHFTASTVEKKFFLRDQSMWQKQFILVVHLALHEVSE